MSRNPTEDDSQDLKLLLNKILDTLMIFSDSTVTQTKKSQGESQRLFRCLQTFQSAFGNVMQKLERLEQELAALKEESKSLQRHCRPNQPPFRAKPGYVRGGYRPESLADDRYYEGSAQSEPPPYVIIPLKCTRAADL